MKLVIAAGMLIIFISIFFVLVTFDVLIKEWTGCFISFGLQQCSAEETGFSLVTGITIIAMFLMVDIVTVYLIFTSLFRKRELL